MKSIVKIWLFVLFFASTAVCSEVPDISLNYISKAACRVSAGPNRGSGVAVHSDKDNIYVLTNAHVVENYSNVNVEFYKFGAKTTPLQSKVNGKVLNQDQDFAILSVSKKIFGELLPEIIPLVPPTYQVKSNSYFATAGNPFSRDMTAREGLILREEGCRIIFTPPPDSGQSGSGLFVRIGDNIYVAGIITFKSGDYSMDVNGNPTTYGVAFNVNQLRKNLQNTSVYDDILYPVVETLFALGSDGRYYPQNEDGSVIVPPGTRIVQWNCPSGTCKPTPVQPGLVPLPGPILPRRSPEVQQAPRTTAPPANNNSSGPFQGLPEGFIDKEEPKPTEADVTTHPQYIELKAKYDALLLEVEALKKQVLDKEQKIVDLEKQIAEKNIPPLNLDIYKKEIDDLKIIIQQKDQQILKYQLDISVLQEALKPPEEIQEPQEPQKPEIQKESLWTKTVNGAKNLNPLWALLAGVAGTLLLGKYKAIATVPAWVIGLFKKKDAIEKVVKNNPELADLMKWLNNKFNSNEAKLSGLTDFISNKLDDVTNKNVVNNNINIDNNEDDGVGSGTGTGAGLDYKKLYRGAPVSDRIKQFFDLKKKDGDSIEKWAFFAILYKEAMQLLRLGKFEIDIVGHKVPLQGQKLAADKIDSWVREQFLKRTTINELDYNYLYHEAMIGFLYKEAIKRLRLGQFPVLGAKETADAVESWVKQEFLDRMGITL